ncbi:MAG: hypothetical protein ACR2FU_01530 [Streptosporangiaceae bacterium]
MSPASPAAAIVGSALCPGRAAARVASALGRAIPASLRGEVVPLGLSGDGSTAYVSAWTPRFAGVAALNLRTGALRPIVRFGRPATDQADGAWGGRWLVWEQTYSLRSLDGFTVYGWDSVTGRLRRLGQSRSGPGGSPWPSPWHAPAVSGQYAAWAQGYGPGGLVQIRLANLRTGRVTILASGHVQAPFFDGRLLVWPGSSRPGALTSLHAAVAATGRPARLPVALSRVRGTDFVVTDGTRTAYFDPELRTLYYSPARDRAGEAVLKLATGVSFSSLGIARGALTWSTTKATYVASTATFGYLQVTPAYGFAVTGTGRDVLVSDAPARKAAHPPLALHVIDAGGITRGRC